MTSPLSNNKEKNEREKGAGSLSENQKSLESEKISETSSNFEKGVSTLVDKEGMEFSDGDVSEDEGKGKQTISSSFSGSSSAAQVATKTIVLPTVEVMRKQVAVEIHKQIDKLEKQAHKMSKQAHFSPFELNAVIGKIRRLRDILANLAYVTAEGLKTWWFEFVKGNTV